MLPPTPPKHEVLRTAPGTNRLHVLYCLSAYVPDTVKKIYRGVAAESAHAGLWKPQELNRICETSFPGRARGQRFHAHDTTSARGQGKIQTATDNHAALQPPKQGGHYEGSVATSFQG